MSSAILLSEHNGRQGTPCIQLNPGPHVTDIGVVRRQPTTQLHVSNFAIPTGEASVLLAGELRTRHCQVPGLNCAQWLTVPSALLPAVDSGPRYTLPRGPYQATVGSHEPSASDPGQSKSRPSLSGLGPFTGVRTVSDESPPTPKFFGGLTAPRLLRAWRGPLTLTRSRESAS